MENIYIYGCGGVGNELAEMLLDSKKYNLLGFIDDNPKIDVNMGLKCLRFDELMCEKDKTSFCIVISIGEPFVREVLSKKIIDNGFKEAILDFSNHYNPKYSKVDCGTILHLNSYISINAILGRSCLINKGAIVGHDCNLGDFCVLSPSVTIGGNVTIGNNTFIGTGACIRNGIRIGRNAIIGMGSVVVKDVDDGDVVVGNPARYIRKNDSHIVFGKK